MKEVQTYGHIQNGILKIHGRDKFNEALHFLTDGRVIVKVEKLYKKRSQEENKYYWGVVINEFCRGYKDMTSEDITPETAHELLKQKCNGKDVPHPETGEILTVGRTTTELTTIQFIEYWDRCRDWIQDWFGIYVPAPNEQMEIFNTKEA
ncbi:MAG: hypothetical protein M0P47_09340 [Bacteroidales bacterium]|nr:hypothetical protein [Bacteroidales bacterium]